MVVCSVSPQEGWFGVTDKLEQAIRAAMDSGSIANVKRAVIDALVSCDTPGCKDGKISEPEWQGEVVPCPSHTSYVVLARVPCETCEGSGKLPFATRKPNDARPYPSCPSCDGRGSVVRVLESEAQETGWFDDTYDGFMGLDLEQHESQGHGSYIVARLPS